MTQTIKNVIRKNPDGTYNLITNIRPDYLCVMTQEQFEELVRQLEEMRYSPAFAGSYYVVHFPEYTYQITG